MASTEPARRGGPAAVPAIATGDVVLALGDSIAAGIGAAHVSEGCMNLLAASLGRHHPGLRLVNLALPGETTTSMLRAGGQLERAEAVIGAASGGRERVAPICLCIGANDAMEAQAIGDDEALHHFRANLDAILARLDSADVAAGGPGAARTVILQTVYNPFEENHRARADELAPRRARRSWHNVELRWAAGRWNVRIADVEAAFAGRADELTWIRSGDIHPSHAGHRLIAQTYGALLGA